MIARSTDIRSALRSRQRGFLLDPSRFAAAAPAGDPLYAQVALLLQCDGANGGTAFADSGPLARTVAPTNVITSTAQVRSGISSAYFAGGSSKLSVDDHASLDLTGDFSIELSAFPTTASGTGVIFSKKATDNGGGWLQLYKNTDTQDLYFVVSIDNTTSGISTLIPGSLFAVGVWHQLEVSRAADVYRLLLDGTVRFSQTLASKPSVDASPFRIGQAGPSNLYPFIGYIDDVRITNGSARHTADYTPSASAFPNF